MAYDAEAYWSRVASEIGRRDAGNVVAGDDDPFHRYRRAKFLKTCLATIDVDGRTVLEVGCGPGGNLAWLAGYGAPEALIGCDISADMVALAEEGTADCDVAVAVHKTDGAHLPLDARSVDVAFTATVLQHCTDGDMLAALVADICRVTRTEAVVMEAIGDDELTRDTSYLARRLEIYAELFAQNGFALTHRYSLKTRVSNGVWRLLNAVFGRRAHREGEAFGPAQRRLMAIALPVTRRLDDLVPDRRNINKLVFVRAA